MINAINKKRGLAKSWVEDLRQRLNPVSATSATIVQDRFAQYLLSLEDQLNLLEVLDANVWGGQANKVGWFDSVDTTSDHVQSVDDLEILYVEFGSPKGNVEMHWKAIVANQPRVWRWDGLKTDQKHLRLGPNAKQYEPGIHRIRINLVAHWEPEDGRTIIDVRRQAAASGETLTHAEVLAVYGLHDELLRQQDGENLPYADMAGFEVAISGGRPWAAVPCLGWDRFDGKARLHAGWADYVSRGWAAPATFSLGGSWVFTLGPPAPFNLLKYLWKVG